MLDAGDLHYSLTLLINSLLVLNQMPFSRNSEIRRIHRHTHSGGGYLEMLKEGCTLSSNTQIPFLSRIHLLAEIGVDNILRFIFRRDTDLGHPMSSLHISALFGDAELTQALLNESHNVDVSFEPFGTPLYAAAS